MKDRRLVICLLVRILKGIKRMDMNLDDVLAAQAIEKQALADAIARIEAKLAALLANSVDPVKVAEIVTEMQAETAALAAELPDPTPAP